jgi:hypothetical protein
MRINEVGLGIILALVFIAGMLAAYWLGGP